MTDIKIKDSKGNIYNSCPFIDKIIQFLDNQIENVNSMKIELEKVRAINEQLRKDSIADGYQDKIDEYKDKIDEYKDKIDEYKDKLEIVEDYLNVAFEGRHEQYFKSYIVEIANKIKELEKENQELKQEINNLTN